MKLNLIVMKRRMRKNLRTFLIIFMAIATSFAFTLQNNYAEDNAIAQINGGQVEQTVNQGGESYAKPNVEQTPKPLETQKSLGNTTEIEEQKTAETMNEEGINSKPNNLDGSDSNSDSNNEIKNEESKINSTEEEKNKDKEVNILTDHKKEEENKNTATPINVKLSKTEVNKMGELSGAKLKLFKVEDGKEIEVKNWESGNSPLELSLEPGTYKMVEEEAPNGYEKGKPVTFTIADNTMNIDTRYNAYSNNPAMLTRLAYIHKPGDESKETVVYCFNVGKHWPVEITDSDYIQKYGSVELFNEAAEKPLLKGDALNEAVLKTIYNGYPYNSAGIKEKYKLTDEQFRRVTQRAIWHYTDSFRILDNMNITERKAYFALTGQEESDVALNSTPEQMTLYLYMPINTEYQNLLGTRFIEPMTTNIENKYTGIKKDKEEGKTSGEKKEESEKPNENRFYNLYLKIIYLVIYHIYS